MERQPRVTDYVSVAEAITLLGISRVTLWRWEKHGKIKSTSVMGRLAFLRSDVERIKKRGRP